MEDVFASTWCIGAFGLVRSSFVSIAAGSTGRTCWTPLGFAHSGSAQTGNMLAARTVLPVTVARAVRVVRHHVPITHA